MSIIGNHVSILLDQNHIIPMALNWHLYIGWLVGHYHYDVLCCIHLQIKGSDKGRPFSEAMSEYKVSAWVSEVLHIIPTVYISQDMFLRHHEDKERELLQKLKGMKGAEGRKPTPPTGDDYVEFSGIRYHMKRGGVGGNTAEVMILVSVGSEFPDGIQVQHRERDPVHAEKAIQTHGHLPPIVTGLHEEAAADVMAVASIRLKDCGSDLVHLCLDVPGKERSKQYYLKKIEEFFKHCQQPQGMSHPISRWFK